MWRCLAFCLLLTLPFGCASVAPPHRPQVAPVGAKAATLTDLGDAVFAATNRVRKRFGYGIFLPKAALTEAAADQTSYMALMERASHTSRIVGERDASERVHRHGYFPPTVAENVLSFKLEEEENPTADELAARALEFWMNSPGHRSNILRRDMEQLGCAVNLVRLPGGDVVVFAAQVFAP
jgi:uncharacterized protein YkwD